ncbi:MAG: hypothetical protein ACXWBN_09995 [Acidimicrobiales bacterium]
MPHTSTSRRTLGAARPAVAALALASLLAAFAFVAIAFVPRPVATATTTVDLGGGARSASTQVALGQMASSGHPDFVGLADPRPSAGLAHLVASPIAGWSLVVAFLVVALAPSAGGSGPPRPRWRRWRARLEGAPPVVA